MHDRGLLAEIRPATIVADAPVLPVVRELVDRLEAASIAHCHWKSNEHLTAAVAGLTDLDVLVGRDNPEQLQMVLAAAGFRRFSAIRPYPAIEDYLAHDHGSGRLVHLHLHHELTVGQPHLKGYRLPWAQRVLAGRRLEPASGIYVAAPEMELLLLLVRSALKERWRDRIRGLAGRPILGSDARRECAWLRERADPTTMLALAGELLGAATAERLGALLEGTWRDRRFRSFAAAVRHSLVCCRTFGPVGAPWLAWMREVAWLADGLNRRYLHRPVPLRRVSPRGGLVVALLGADGSGKSTLTAALRRWLGVKLDVVPIYFGSGDGPSSLYRLPLRALARRLQSKAPRDIPGSPPVDSCSLLRRLGRVPWAIALAAEKRSKLRRMTCARNRGMIVVCDRFPQNQRLGFNDGPLLGGWTTAPGRLRRFLANWEAAIYDSATSAGLPDLVVKLIATPTVAVARKPEMSLEENRRRVESIRSLFFSSPTLVVEIDADQALDLMVSEVKAIIWRLL